MFLADRLTLYQPEGVDYAPHLGMSSHLLGTLLQPCYTTISVKYILMKRDFCEIILKMGWKDVKLY